MPNIVRLHFGENQFSGSLPVVSSWPAKLDNFFANNNELSGTLPSNLQAWSHSSKWFSVASNQLSGSLPAEFLTAGGFAFFRVDNNRLSGTLPTTIGLLSNLTRLNISHNFFEGNATLPALSVANECFISNNQFQACAAPFGGDCCIGFSNLLPFSDMATTTTAASLFDSGTAELATSNIVPATARVPAPPSVITLPPNIARDDGDVALIAGIVVGVLLLLVVVGVVGLIVYRNQRSRASVSSQTQSATAYGVIPALSHTYSDIDDVRRPRGDYDAADSRLHA